MLTDCGPTRRLLVPSGASISMYSSLIFVNVIVAPRGLVSPPARSSDSPVVALRVRSPEYHSLALLSPVPNV